MSLQTEIIQRDPGTTTLALRGRLDSASHESFDAAALNWFAGAPAGEVGHSFVLDLAGLDYISSAGLRSVFKARKEALAHGHRLLVLGAQPQVQKVFDIVKAVPLSEIFASNEELDAYLDEIQQRMLDPDAD
ncbi:MAG: STAS domain-containing protein [Aquimonas sp.]|nr:STAS domain-containing protein [Aquimonas sp.]